ncbi:DUF5666 domain-containing protein [Nocardia sp. NPDC050710]|uniref:DUF5666 domain-containing protein n=1 Tax=Nocardia sp. NPDC050710 TaxID=3157220 RepID=UPI0033DCD65C
MTNPKDPWGPGPGDAPTEHLGSPGQSGSDKSGYTDDPTEAYGSGAAQAPRYPATEQFTPWAPPPAHATQQLPTHEGQWGAYESGGAYDSGYGSTWSGAPGQPGAMPPGATGLPPEPPKRNTGLWIALALCVIALIAVAGVVAGVMLGNKDSESTTTAGTTTRSLPTAGRTPTGTAPSGLPSPTAIPGLPGLEGLGATMGTISANSGGTLTLSALSGEKVTVHTTDETKVISLSGAKASDLKVGDIVMVQGDKDADGSIRAEIIISTSLPTGPR